MVVDVNRRHVAGEPEPDECLDRRDLRREPLGDGVGGGRHGDLLSTADVLVGRNAHDAVSVLVEIVVAVLVVEIDDDHHAGRQPGRQPQEIQHVDRYALSEIPGEQFYYISNHLTAPCLRDIYTSALPFRSSVTTLPSKRLIVRLP